MRLPAERAMPVKIQNGANTVTLGSISVNSLAGFVLEVVNNVPPGNITRTYRGHAKHEYKLQPSLYRSKEYIRDEKNIIRELISLHPSEFQEDRSAFDQLVRMQHYNLKTRLLDVTFNPLVALYFATVENFDCDGHVVLLDVVKRSVKYYDSDTVSCIANLSSLTSAQRRVVNSFTNDKQLADSVEGRHLLHFIRTEKPYFEPKIEVADLNSVWLVKPKLNNRRILAQQGAFYIFGLSRELDPVEDEISIMKINVPKEAKKIIQRELDTVNINGSTLFPEIESASKYIMGKLLPG